MELPSRLARSGRRRAKAKIKAKTRASSSNRNQRERLVTVSKRKPSPKSQQASNEAPSNSNPTSRLIPIKPAPSLPSAVAETCKKLADKGFKAWLAGGCVRDMIMSRKPRDWDVVTDAPLESIKELFPKHIEVGAAFGIIKLPPVGPEADPVSIDIAIFRREEGYSDRRHPDVVEVGNEQTDVARRDFTVNAMYFDPTIGNVIDYTNGHKDIQSKLLKTVGAPNERFSEDALRILRAVRFSAQLGFKIDRDTSNALKKCAPLLKDISRERVREEVWRLLSTARPIMGLEAIAQNGLWEQVFGVRRVGIPADLRQLKLSWTPTPLHWLAGMGVTGLLGDPLKEAGMVVERLTERLKLSNNEKRILNRILRVYEDSVSDCPDSSPSDWVELAREDKALFDLTKAFVRRARGPTEEQKQEAIGLIEQTMRWAAKPGSEKTWPQAQDLMKEGLKAGPKLGAELKARQWKTFWATKPA